VAPGLVTVPAGGWAGVEPTVEVLHLTVPSGGLDPSAHEIRIEEVS